MDSGASKPSSQQATLDGFLQWASHKNITIGSICPTYVPHRGLGVITTRPVKAAEVVLRIPISLSRTLDTVSPSVRDAMPSAISLHGLLASDLAVSGSSGWDAWASLVPDLESFRTAMPWFWPSELQSMLPVSVRRVIERQSASFAKDWDLTRAVYRDLPKDKYLHAWLLVNSRSFYYLTTTMEHLPHLDRLILMPVADLFNHGPGGAGVQFDDTEYIFIADRDYAAGEEMCIAYGDHSNDFLLAEYGFIMDENPSDGFSVEDVLQKRLGEQQVAQLRALDCLKDFTLSGSPYSRETSVMLGMLKTGESELESFLVVDGELKSNPQQEKSLLASLLGELVEHANETLGRLGQSASKHHREQQGVLIQRWQQIREMATEKQLACRNLPHVP